MRVSSTSSVPKGVGPWPVGKVATVTTELEGQEMIFLNGGSAYQLNPSLSFFVRCDSQQEIDTYWDKLIDGGKPMACGWLIDRFGLCWQIVPRNIGHPKAMQAMLSMIKMDLPALEAAVREVQPFPLAKTSANSHVKPPGPPQIVKRQEPRAFSLTK